MKIHSHLALTAAITLALAGFAVAGNAANTSTASATSDATFVHSAAQGGMAEVELSKLAQIQASSREVKSFASTMVDAHTKNNAKLASIAQSEGIDVPTDLDAEHAALKSKLSTLSGADFDREYSDAMRKDHTKMLQLLDDNSKNIQDAKLKAYIGETRPAVAEHLKMAKSLPGS